MKNDAVINQIAHTIGCSRKEVISTLKQFGMLSQKPQYFMHRHKE